MPRTRWARLSQDVDCGLRRGAWYPATLLSQTQVALEIDGRLFAYPVRQLEVTTVPPDRWTVVANVGNASVIPRFWAKGYAVCPRCSSRQLLTGRPPSMRCDACDGLFEIYWDEAYLQT